jgi:hypothetical protein
MSYSTINGMRSHRYPLMGLGDSGDGLSGDCGCGCGGHGGCGPSMGSTESSDSTWKWAGVGIGALFLLTMLSR